MPTGREPILRWQWMWCGRCSFVHRLDAACLFTPYLIGKSDPHGAVVWHGKEPFVWQDRHPTPAMLQDLEATMMMVGGVRA